MARRNPSLWKLEQTSKARVLPSLRDCGVDRDFLRGSFKSVLRTLPLRVCMYSTISMSYLSSNFPEYEEYFRRKRCMILFETKMEFVDCFCQHPWGTGLKSEWRYPWNWENTFSAGIGLVSSVTLTLSVAFLTGFSVLGFGGRLLRSRDCSFLSNFTLRQFPSISLARKPTLIILQAGHVLYFTRV